MTGYIDASKVAKIVIKKAWETAPNDEHYLSGAEVAFRDWIKGEGKENEHDKVWKEAVKEHWNGEKNGDE